MLATSACPVNRRFEFDSQSETTAVVAHVAIDTRFTPMWREMPMARARA